jgi:hypothetical protein
MAPETVEVLVEISKKDDFKYSMILEVFDVRLLHQAMGLASSPVAAGVNENESVLLFQNFMRTQAESAGANAVMFGTGGVYVHPMTRQICYGTVVSRWADYPYWILDQVLSGLRRNFCRLLELEKHDDGHSELSVFFSSP